jgi:hypothetical protein
MNGFVGPFSLENVEEDKIDSILNPHLRLEATFDEIKKLINNFKYDKDFVYSQCEVLEHNQNLLLNFDKNEALYFLYNKLIKL